MKLMIAIFLFLTTSLMAQFEQVPLKKVRAKNANLFTKLIITSGQPDQADLDLLRKSGLSRIINLRTPGEVSGGFLEENWAKKHQLDYINIPVSSQTFSLAQAIKLNEILDSSKPTLLHCSSSNRVGALLAVDHFLFTGANKEPSILVGRKFGLSSWETKVSKLLNAKETIAMQKRIQQGKRDIITYGNKLKKLLSEGLQKGPEHAIDACHLAMNKMGKHPVHRTTLKPRNVHNRPNSAFKEKLLQLEQEKAQNFQLISDKNKTWLAKPIYIKPLCTTCHGVTPSEKIQTKLKVLYPQDQALGYKVGDFRGIFFTEI